MWLGLTLGCARCHDHKFDPLSQKEYYQFFAYFNNVQEKGMVWNFGNEDPLIPAPTPEQEARLSALESEASAAARRWHAMADSAAMEQGAWERDLANSPGADWAPRRGLAAHAAFDGNLSWQAFMGGSIDGTRKPETSRDRVCPGTPGFRGGFRRDAVRGSPASSASTTIWTRSACPRGSTRRPALTAR